LNVDPDHRYRIEDIKQHKWWKLSPEVQCSSGLIVGFHKMPIDFTILEKLKELKFDIDLTQKCIEANRHNNSTTTYYLLLKKFLK
jgi:5'-AMP-activated protein kinase catalytic alpha subunit